MQANSAPAPAQPDHETRRTLKKVARRLFSERGIRAVSVREIAVAAGQRNMGAVAYHFVTKDALLRELLTDGAERIEARRHQVLDAMEAEGGPRTVAEAVSAIVLPSVQFSDEDVEFGSFFNRFLLRVGMYESDFVDRVLQGRYNAGYQRCLTHLRRLLNDMPRDAQNLRFVFLGSYLSSLIAQRETILADRSVNHPHWRSEETVQDIIQTAAALLCAARP